MGQSKSSDEKKEQHGGLFSWQKLEPPNKELIHYDPRYEHIEFTDKSVWVSDFHNRLFEWEGKLDANTKPNGYELKSFQKYEYDNSTGTRAGKRFDKNASSLAWIRKTDLYYYDIKTEKVSIFDVSEWICAKYGDGNTAKIPPKSIINLGNGQVIVQIYHFKGTDKAAANIDRGTDLAHIDILNKKEIKTVPIQSELLKDVSNQTRYWGFQLNPNGKEVAVLIQGDRNVTYVCFVSLSDGNVIWQSRFDFVHNLLFNKNGKYACVFERPRKTEYGYVHVLNLARLEWHCQIRLTYGTSPLGWDGFTWLGDSLVFMAPFELRVVSVGALEWRIAETKKQNEMERKEKEARSQKQSQESEDENVAESEEKMKDENENVITPAKFDEILQQQKSKVICVLSIGERWWDLEKETMSVMYSQVEDEEISKLILEFAGLGWAMIKFPYPFHENTEKKDENTMLLQGAQSEVFECGRFGEFNVLLLAKIARDPRTNIFNHWVMRACTVPKTFGEMWKNKNIQQGVIGQITAVNEESNLKTLDAYK